jgi:hypothetical protein
MTKALNIIAIFFVLIGVIGFIVSIDGIKETKRTSDFWKQSASENYDNNLIAAEAIQKKSAYTVQLTTSIVILVSGIVVGVFFLALSKIISVLESIRDRKIDVQNPVSNTPILST